MTRSNAPFVALFVVVARPFAFVTLLGSVLLGGVSAAAQASPQATVSPSLDADWRVQATERANALRKAQPALGAAFHSLKGIDPAHYLQRRRPEPEVARELVRLNLPAPILIDAWLKETRGASSAHRFSSPSDFPPPLQKQAAALIVAEQVAFRDGLLLAAARQSDSLVPVFLRSVALDASVPEATRQLAASQLGRSGPSQLSVLQGLATDATLPHSVRAGATVGLGSLRIEAALLFLTSLLDTPELALPAARSIAAVGARSALQQRAGRVLAQRLPLATDAALREALVQGISICADTALLDTLATQHSQGVKGAAKALRMVQRKLRRQAHLLR